MNDDLRTRYDALTANIKEQREQFECGATPQLIAKALSWSSRTLDEAMGLAQDAMERLEENARATVAATGYNPDSPGFDACVNAVMREQKPLDCQGVEFGGRGKMDVRECEIEGGSVDIREFTCRRS